MKKLLATMLVFLATLTSADAQAVRRNINDMSAADVASLRRGVEVMRSRDSARRGSAEFQRSWAFWTNVHGHFGSGCDGPVSGQGMAGVVAWTARGTAENAAWCSCEHGSDRFLLWHRIFTDQFEDVLRQASGNPNLMLPYWDYAANPVLPRAYRETTYRRDGRTLPNPLFESRRRAQVNAGASLATNTASAANAQRSTTFTQFRQRLEQAPHNAVHCALGVAGCGSGLMGAFATAAGDPAFWLHHANVDRLYECWLRAGDGRLPADRTTLDQSFAMPDRNGAVVQRRVRDNLTSAQLGFRYSAGSDCPAPSGTARVAQTVTVLGEATEAPVEFEATEDVTLVISGVTASANPGAMFDVYLANKRGLRVLVGIIDFFGEQPGDANAHHGRPAGRSFEFDVTLAVEMLGIKPTDKPTLIFEATTGLEGSTPEAAGLNRDAEVTYRRARLKRT